MRCNNCGWDEPNPNVNTCVKCGHPLQEAPAYAYSRPAQAVQPQYPVEEEEEIKKTRVYNGSQLSEMQQLKQTVVQGAASQQPMPLQQPAIVQTVCPRCGYPIVGDYCARCGYPGQEPMTNQPVSPKTNKDISELLARGNKCSKCGEQVPSNFRFCPQCGAPIERGTINPFDDSRQTRPEEKPDVAEQPKPRFTLTLIIKNADPETVETREYEGDTVILKRDNTDPDNRTITTKEQAVLNFEDGQWVIENRNEFGSTLVTANRKIALQAGDVIMLGNRRFRFETVSNE